MLPRFLVLTSVLLASPAWAQDSASTHISLTIPKLVQITELQDIDLGEWSGSGDVQADQQLCVWSSTGSYSLSGTSDNGAADQFRLARQDSQTLGYQVYWDDGNGFRELRNGQSLTNLTAAQERACAGDKAVRPSLRVRVDGATLATAASGDYRDHLSLTVVAE